MEKAPFPESIELLHQEELPVGIMVLYKDETGFRHAFYSHSLGYWTISGNGCFNPPDGLTWTMIHDPNIPIASFAGVITDDEITDVMVRQLTLHRQAKIIDTEKGRIWYTYFDRLENADPGQPSPLKIEGLSSRGQLIWKEGIYEGKLFRGRTKE